MDPGVQSQPEQVLGQPGLHREASLEKPKGLNAWCGSPGQNTLHSWAIPSLVSA